MKVLGIGESVIDKIISDDSNGKPRLNRGKHIGGPSPIALIVLARLGITCTLLTTLGNDENGTIIEEVLAKERIMVMAQREVKTKVNTYTINKETGARKKIRGTTIHNHIENLDKNFLQQFDAIIIDRHEQKAFYELMKKKSPKTKIIIDTSVEVSAFTLNMIQYADYPIIPIEAAKQIGLEEVYKLAKKPIIVTAGADGSIIFDGQNKLIIPSHKVKAVDVQGAGDVYRGAFTYGILHQWEITDCARFANKVAALHCTKLGNAAAVPTKEELGEFIL